ncbi:hypothetical protein AAMO2058_000961500 [Amorphochlora amoebiformis]
MSDSKKEAMDSGVTVCCRFRPVNENESKRNELAKCIVEFPADNTIAFSQETFTDLKLNLKSSQFNFDHVFPPGASQEEVFTVIGKGVVRQILNGYNSTVFAYGQTGSGKSFTMMGVPYEPEICGLIPRVVEEIFQSLEEKSTKSPSDTLAFTVQVSYVEIYMEKIKDLIDPSKSNLKLRETKGKGVYIQDVTSVFVSSSEEVYSLIELGSANRAIGSTEMNAESSRSHSVFILKVGQMDSSEGGSNKNATLFLVDLAGSEKVRKTKASGQTLKEAMQINKSLSALGNVIKALTKASKHVPYRDSKLTRLLSDALGGNCKTCLVLTASPALYNSEETLSTLRFGRRAKMIKNKPIANTKKSVDHYEKLLKAAEKTIAQQKDVILALKEQLGRKGSSFGSQGDEKEPKGKITKSKNKTNPVASESHTNGGKPTKRRRGSAIDVIHNLHFRISSLEKENAELDKKNGDISDLLLSLQSELAEKSSHLLSLENKAEDFKKKFIKSQANLQMIETSVSTIYEARLECAAAAHLRRVRELESEITFLKRRVQSGSKGGSLKSFFSSLFKSRKPAKPPPPSSQTQVTKGDRFFVSNESGVNVRAQPSLKARLLGVISKGQCVTCELVAEKNEPRNNIHHLWIKVAISNNLEQSRTISNNLEKSRTIFQQSPTISNSF